MEVELDHFLNKEWFLAGVDHQGPGAFRLYMNDTVINFYEDDSDNLRSQLQRIEVIPTPRPDEMPTNRFPTVLVRTRMSETQPEVLQFIDARNGKLVIEVGTDWSDDYYPSFVGYFNPQALSLNSPSKGAKTGGLDFAKRRLRVRAAPGHPARRVRRTRS